MDLHQKSALITGGTLGIGAAIAKEFARRGANVALAARTIGEAAVTLQREIETLGVRCVLIQADVAKREDCVRSVAEAAQQLDGLHVLVTNAGGPAPGKIEDITADDWQYAMDVHVNAVFHLCQAALPHLRRNSEGAIVTVSSTAGIRGVPGAIAYATAKGAMPQFTRSLARDLADANIRVNCVAPGIIRTRFHEDMPAERQQFNLQHRIPLHREGTPEQVADVVAMLATNDYLTGETIVIDGGLTSRIV
jgi:NAD(P)-dependent dehydrogenase (short-subunit alcohol dehydrogenase family)